jgi:hypothetical protein
MYDIIGHVITADKTKVTCLSQFADGNPDWKKLTCMGYNHCFKAFDSLGRVRTMAKQHYTAQQGMTRARKKLEELW